MCNMVFKICVVDGDIQFDALPVGKIIDYPLEKRDYKPFSQFRAAINQEGLHLQLWAFEVEQTAQSEMKAVLNLNPKGSMYFDLTLHGDYTAELTICNEADHSTMNYGDTLVLHKLDGEDLQGIYWGAEILIPMKLIDEIFGKTEFTKDDVVTGNLFKQNKAEPKPHYGCFFPVDFGVSNPYGPRYFGEFPIFLY